MNTIHKTTFAKIAALAAAVTFAFPLMTQAATIPLFGGNIVCSIFSQFALFSNNSAMTCTPESGGGGTGGGGQGGGGSQNGMGQLNVVKIVKNSQTSAALASDYTIHVTGQTSSFSFPGSSAGHVVSLPPGSYNVTESGGTGGFVMATSSNCNGSIAAGDFLTCVITNDFTNNATSSGGGGNGTTTPPSDNPLSALNIHLHLPTNVSDVFRVPFTGIFGSSSFDSSFDSND